MNTIFNVSLVGFFVFFISGFAHSISKSSDGLFDIGNSKKMYLRCEGQGEPTVLLESGFRNNSDVWTVSPQGKKSIFSAIAEFTRVCVYDRPGTIGWEINMLSRSSDRKMPRNVEEIVTDLHTLLQIAKVKKPMVIVGHSLGGLMTRIYAYKYPEDVVGLILVDSTTEYLPEFLTKNQWQSMKILTTKTPEELKNLKNLENIDFGEAVDALTKAKRNSSISPIPVVIIARGKPMATNSEFPSTVLEDAWSKGQHKLASSLPNSSFIVAKESEHYVQFFQPELIIDAVHQVVEAVRENQKRI